MIHNSLEHHFITLFGCTEEYIKTSFNKMHTCSDCGVQGHRKGSKKCTNYVIEITEENNQYLYEFNTELEPNIHTELQPHQIDHLKKMIYLEQDKNYNGGLLADGMGMGKTLTMISFILNCYKNNKDELTLIITPPQLRQSWVDQIIKHTKNLSYLELKTNKDIINYCSSQFRNNYTIILVGSSLLSNEKLHELRTTRIVFDEAHLIKNYVYY